MPIRNPIEWGVDQFKYTIFGVESANRGLLQTEADAQLPLPAVRRITVADLRDVLARGASDFGANRTDVIFLCVMYPVIGVVLASLAAGHHMLPLLFPLASGFALIGPFAGVGLNEMSRRRELGIGAGWTDAFRVLSSPSLGAIILLGLVLTGVFFFWLVTAYAIYDLTMGPWLPASPAVFIHDVLLTRPGRELIVIGVGVGFLFAAVVLVISVVAFPLLLDRDGGSRGGRQDVGSCRDRQSRSDLPVGTDRRRRPGDRVDPCVRRSHHRPARAWPLHLASVSQDGGAAMTRVPIGAASMSR